MDPTSTCDTAIRDTAIQPERPPEVVTLGETMVLFWPADGAPLDAASHWDSSLGGAESNFALALARLGHRTRWISRLGDDPFGRLVRATLQREGIVVDAPPDPRAPTAVFFKERAAHGPRRVVYYRRGSAASLMGPGDLDPAHLAGARVLHVTGITPALSRSCAAAVDHAVTLAREAGLLVSVDPNVRPQLWADRETCRAALTRLVSRADLVLLGHEDAEILYPGLDEDSVLAAIAVAGPRTVVLKLGERGARGVCDGTQATVEPYPVVAVDTVGAGDGFDAGFIAGLLRGYPFARCLALGARIGAAAVATAGDWEGYPFVRDLEPTYR